MLPLRPSSSSNKTIVEEQLSSSSQATPQSSAPIEFQNQVAISEERNNGELEREVSEMYSRAFPLPYSTFWSRIQYSFAHLQETILDLVRYEASGTYDFPGRLVVMNLDEEFIISATGSLSSLGDMVIRARRIHAQSGAILRARGNFDVQGEELLLEPNSTLAIEENISFQVPLLNTSHAQIVSRRGSIIWLPSVEERSAHWNASSGTIHTHLTLQAHSPHATIDTSNARVVIGNLDVSVHTFNNERGVLAAIRGGSLNASHQANNSHGVLVLGGEESLLSSSNWDNSHGRIRFHRNGNLSVQTLAHRTGIIEAGQNLIVSIEEAFHGERGVFNAVSGNLHILGTAVLEAPEGIFAGRTNVTIRGRQFHISREGALWTLQEASDLLVQPEHTWLDHRGRLVTERSPGFRRHGSILVPEGAVTIHTQEQLVITGDVATRDGISHISQSRNINVIRSRYYSQGPIHLQDSTELNIEHSSIQGAQEISYRTATLNHTHSRTISNRTLFVSAREAFLTLSSLFTNHRQRLELGTATINQVNLVSLSNDIFILASGVLDITRLRAVARSFFSHFQQLRERNSLYQTGRQIVQMGNSITSTNTQQSSQAVLHLARQGSNVFSQGRIEAERYVHRATEQSGLAGTTIIAPIELRTHQLWLLESDLRGGGSIHSTGNVHLENINSQNNSLHIRTQGNLHLNRVNLSHATLNFYALQDIYLDHVHAIGQTAHITSRNTLEVWQTILKMAFGGLLRSEKKSVLYSETKLNAGQAPAQIQALNGNLIGENNSIHGHSVEIAAQNINYQNQHQIFAEENIHSTGEHTLIQNTQTISQTGSNITEGNAHLSIENSGNSALQGNVEQNGGYVQVDHVYNEAQTVKREGGSISLTHVKDDASEKVENHANLDFNADHYEAYAPTIENQSDGSSSISNSNFQGENISLTASENQNLNHVEADFEQLNVSGSSLQIIAAQARGEIAAMNATNGNLIISESTTETTHTILNSSENINVSNSQLIGNTTSTSEGNQTHTDSSYQSGVVSHTSNSGNIYHHSIDFTDINSLTTTALQGTNERIDSTITATENVVDEAQHVVIKNTQETVKGKRVIRSAANIELENAEMKVQEDVNFRATEDVITRNSAITTDAKFVSQAKNSSLHSSNIDAQHGVDITGENATLTDSNVTGNQEDLSIVMQGSNTTQNSVLSGYNTNFQGEEVSNSNSQFSATNTNRIHGVNVRDSDGATTGAEVVIDATQSVALTNQNLGASDRATISAPNTRIANSTVQAGSQTHLTGTEQLRILQSSINADHIENRGGNILQQDVQQTAQTILEEGKNLEKNKVEDCAKQIIEKVEERITLINSQTEAEEKISQEAPEVHIYNSTESAPEVSIETDRLEIGNSLIDGESNQIIASEATLIDSTVSGANNHISIQNQASLINTHLDGITTVDSSTGRSNLYNVVSQGDFSLNSQNILSTGLQHQEGRLNVQTQQGVMAHLNSNAQEIAINASQNFYTMESNLASQDSLNISSNRMLHLHDVQMQSQTDANITAPYIHAPEVAVGAVQSINVNSSEYAHLPEMQAQADHIDVQANSAHLKKAKLLGKKKVDVQTQKNLDAPEIAVNTQNLNVNSERANLESAQFTGQAATISGREEVAIGNSRSQLQSLHIKSENGEIDAHNSHNNVEAEVHLEAATLVNHEGATTESNTIKISADHLNNKQGTLNGSAQLKLTSQSVDNQNGTIAGTLQIDARDLNNNSGLLAPTGNSEINVDRLHTDDSSSIRGQGRLQMRLAEWNALRGDISIAGDLHLVAPELELYGNLLAHALNIETTDRDLRNYAHVVARMATLVSAANFYNENALEGDQINISAAVRLLNAPQAMILATDTAQLQAWLIENLGEIGAENVLRLSQESRITNIGNAWANHLLSLESEGDIALSHALSNHGSIALNSREGNITIFHPVTTDGGIDASAENISIQNRVAAGRFSQFYARNNFEVVRTQVGFGGGFAVHARVFRNQAGEIDAVGNSSIDVDEFHNVGDREIPRSRRGLWGLFGRRRWSGDTRNPYHVTPARIRLQGDLTINARLKARNEGSDIFVSGNMRVMGNRLENINYTHTHVERIQCGKKRRFGRRSKKLYRNEHHTILDRAANLLVGGDLDLHLMQGLYNQGNIGAHTLRLTFGDLYNGRSFADSKRQDTDPIATPQFAERRPFPPLPIFPERKAPTPTQPSIPTRMQRATLADGDCAFHALLGQSQNGAPLSAPQGRANFVRDLQARWGAGELSDRLYNDLQLQLTEMLANPHPLFERLERENPTLWRSYQNTLWLHRNVSTSSEALQHSSVVRQVYLWLLSQSDYWLDQIELGIVAQLYDLSVDLYQPEQGTSGDNPYGRESLHRSSNPNAAVIAVYYNGIDHFERLQVPATGDAKKKPVRQEVTTTMPRADVAQQEAQLQQFRTETVQDPFNRYQAEMQVRNLVMNSFNTGDLINAGFITVQESMQVQVRNFIIERLYRDVYEDVKVRKSFGRSKIVQEHLRKLVDSGEIQVKVAEIIASHNFHNKGGRLYAEERVEIDADTIRNTAVTQDVLIKGRAGSKDKWCGGKNHSVGKEIESGEIVSGGDMVLHANSLIEQIGSKLLSIGDQVQIAKKIVHSSEHHTFVVERKKGWGSSVCKEGHASERSISASEMGSVKMYADTVHVSGSTVAAADTVQIVGEEEIAFTSRQIHMTIKTRRARAGLGVSSTSTERNDVHLEQPYVVGTNVVFLSPKGDIRAKGLEVHASEDLYVRACKDIVFTAEQVCYYVRTHGWSVAVSFFGSAALEALFSGSSGKTALGALLRESSFLSSLADLKGSKGAAGVAASSLTALLSGMQAYDTAKHILNGPQGIKNGLTDAAGLTKSTTDPTTGQTETKVNPAITVRVGTSKSEQMQEVSYATNATAANATFISEEENIKFLGGTNVQAQDSIEVEAAKDFAMEAAHDRFSSSNKSAGVSVSFFSRGGGLISGGFDMARGSGSGVTHTPAKMHSDNIQVKAENVSLQGAQVHGNEDVRVTAQSLHVESLQNTAQSKQMSMSATVGVGSASGSYSSQRSNRSVVDDVCGITSGDRLEADIAGQTTIIGGMIASELGNMDFRSQKIEFRDLENSEKSSGFSIGVGASKNSNGTKDATGSVGFNKSSQKGVTRATLGGGNVVTESDISQLNRDTGRTQERGKKREVRGKASGSLRAVEDLLDRAASVGNFFEALATKVPAKYKSAQERKLYRSLIAAGANAEVAQWIMDSAQHRQVISESGVPLEMVVAQAQYAMQAPIPAELEDNPQAIALYRAFVSLGCLPEEAQKYLTDTPQEAEPVDTSTSTPAAPPIQEEAPTSSTPPEEDNTSEPTPVDYLQTGPEAPLQEKVEAQQYSAAQEERLTEAEPSSQTAPISIAQENLSPEELRIQELSREIAWREKIIAQGPGPINHELGEEISALSRELNALAGHGFAEQLQDLCRFGADRVSKVAVDNIGPFAEQLADWYDKNPRTVETVLQTYNIGLTAVDWTSTAAAILSAAATGGASGAAKAGMKITARYARSALKTWLIREISEWSEIPFDQALMLKANAQFALAMLKAKPSKIIKAAKDLKQIVQHIKQLKSQGKVSDKQLLKLDKLFFPKKTAADHSAGDQKLAKIALQKIRKSKAVTENSDLTPSRVRELRISQNKDRFKIKGKAEQQVTDKGLSKPEVLTPQELQEVHNWSNHRNQYLKKWREKDLSMYSDTLKKILNSGSAEEQIKKHMTPDDLAACLKEARGVVIPKPDGGIFDHLNKERKQAGNGIKNTIAKIQNALENDQTLTNNEKNIATEKLRDLSKLHNIYNKNLPK